MRDPVVIDARFGSLQLCVPGHWSDLQVLEFAEDEQPCGANSGWKVRSERKSCADHRGMIHIVVAL